MPVIRIETPIEAPPERCFDLARSVEAHLQSTAKTGERLVGGVTSGLIGPGETVTWEAIHFGVRQRLTSRITRFERPRLFVDEMVRGAFRSFVHAHEFIAEGDVTRMIDRFEFESPFGILGRIADSLLLTAHMRRFLIERASELKRAAEQSLNARSRVDPKAS